MPLTRLLTDFSRLIYPNICKGCGRDLYNSSNLLCWHCLQELPRTGYELHADNYTAKIFYGRLPLENACSWLFFNKGALTQHLVHQLKYKGNLKLGRYLGELLAKALLESGLYNNVDVLVPLPLNKRKMVKRGFNQSVIICEGMSPVLGVPIENIAVFRKKYTETQTKKNRIQRIANVQDVFDVQDAKRLENKHALLVDDVITTGATMEACGAVLLKIPGLKLSMASIAIASKL
jgi:ComF family protein